MLLFMIDASFDKPSEVSGVIARMPAQGFQCRVDVRSIVHDLLHAWSRQKARSGRGWRAPAFS